MQCVSWEYLEALLELQELRYEIRTLCLVICPDAIPRDMHDDAYASEFILKQVGSHSGYPRRSCLIRFRGVGTKECSGSTQVDLGS
jgi:hypothetical protein